MAQGQKVRDELFNASRHVLNVTAHSNLRFWRYFPRFPTSRGYPASQNVADEMTIPSGLGRAGARVGASPLPARRIGSRRYVRREPDALIQLGQGQTAVY